MILLQIKLNYYDIALIGTATGFLLGLIPLVLGFVKKERSYGVFGFLGSLIGGTLLGIFLSVPVAAIFSWLILRKPKVEKPINVSVVNENPIDVSMKDSDAS